jgi:hypothetical protein
MSIRLRLILVWAFLSGLTVLSWWLATRGDQTRAFDMGVTPGVMAIALVKARFIISDFMEAGRGPGWIFWATTAWMGLLFSACFALYLYADMRV